MRRLMILVLLVATLTVALAATTAPAFAQKLIGCGSKLEWPCPGPAL
jgi:hypothetical protein